MQNRTDYLMKRRETLFQFLNFHGLENKSSTTDSSLKLYFYPVSEETLFQYENLYLINRDLYKEDHGTFLVLLESLKQRFATPNVELANFIVIPINLNLMSQFNKSELIQIISSARKMVTTQRLIFFCMGDFSMKFSKRSSLFERILFKNLENNNEFIFTSFRSSDVFIQFESTIDFIHNDIPIFPLIETSLTKSYETERKYLFSFVGEYYRSGWPEGFIRSPSKRKVWEQLGKRNTATSLITQPDNIQNIDLQNPYIEIPKRSIFTLCPRGITSWSFRIFESILSGSIPVILSDSHYKQFSEIIPWDLFCLHYPENCLSSIDEILENLSPIVVKQLQRELDLNQHWFTAKGLVDLVSRKLAQKSKN